MASRKPPNTTERIFSVKRGGYSPMLLRKKGKKYVNPIWPGLFWCISYRGGHIVPRLNIFGLGRVRVPILFGNDLPRSDLPYTKGFMKFGCPEPSKKVFDFWNFCSSKWRLTRFVRVPPYEILVFPTNFIFFQGNEITLRGKKCTALFQTHNWEKSSFFNELVRTRICTEIRKYVTGC